MSKVFFMSWELESEDEGGGGTEAHVVQYDKKDKAVTRDLQIYGHSAFELLKATISNSTPCVKKLGLWVWEGDIHSNELDYASIWKGNWRKPTRYEAEQVINGVFPRDEDFGKRVARNMSARMEHG